MFNVTPRTAAVTAAAIMKSPLTISYDVDNNAAVGIVMATNGAYVRLCSTYAIISTL